MKTAKSNENGAMKVLCVTHSDRSFLEARCEINFLQNRFPKNRFENHNSTNAICGIKQAVPYNGALTLWKIDETDYSLQFIRRYLPDYKVQFASFHDDKLVIFGSDRIEVLNTEFTCSKTIGGPHLVGGHTIHFDAEGYAWVNSAPGNKIMKVNIDTEEIVETIQMPSIYGNGINLDNKDLRDYFVPTDLQPTHVNCAFPHKDSVYVTLWIQGAVGAYDANRNYNEIISGFRGIHSGKIESQTGKLYFTDSPAGILWFYDLDQGKLVHRFKINSQWVHDTDHIENDIYVAGLSDANTVQVISIEKMKMIHEYYMDDFGKSVMFVNCCEVDDRWGKMCTSDSRYFNDTELIGKTRKNILPRIANPIFWKLSENAKLTVHDNISKENSLFISSNADVSYEYLIRSEPFSLPIGKYSLTADIECQKGGVSIGLIKKNSEEWLVQFNLDTYVKSNYETLNITTDDDEWSVVIAANNTIEKEPNEFFLDAVRLEPMFDMAEKDLIGIIDTFDINKSIMKLQAQISDLKLYASGKEMEIDNLINEYQKLKTLNDQLIEDLNSSGTE